MERPEYFVVRLYRRATEDPARIEGLVEVVGIGKSYAFANAHELWAIMLDPFQAQASAGSITPAPGSNKQS
jgi:hypothetical protein